MLIGPSKVLFMDEISNGLDSSTTFQIVTCLQQLAHISGSTILISLLQPAPETFELFDDIILMSEGRVIYHGPRTNVLEFFEGCGFICPPRKGIADFLQEVCLKFPDFLFLFEAFFWFVLTNVLYFYHVAFTFIINVYMQYSIVYKLYIILM